MMKTTPIEDFYSFVSRNLNTVHVEESPDSVSQKMKFANSIVEGFAGETRLNHETRETEYDDCINEALKASSPEVFQRMKGALGLKKFGI